MTEQTSQFLASAFLASTLASALDSRKATLSSTIITGAMF